MKFTTLLNDIQENIFNIVIFISYILIVCSFFGLSSIAPHYLDNLDYYVRIYICLFLLWRFNPLRKIDIFTNLDRKIVFSAGLFILTTSALNEYVINVKDKLKKSIQYVKTNISSK